MPIDDLSLWLPVVIFVIFMAIIILFVLVAVIFSVILSISPFAIIGLIFTRKAKEAREAVQASQSWMPTTGKVLKSRVEVSGGDYTHVKPRVIYEYDVNGQTYQNDIIKASDRILVIQTRGSREAYDTVDRYPEGAVVTVYYNPQNPSQAVLER